MLSTTFIGCNWPHSDRPAIEKYECSKSQTRQTNQETRHTKHTCMLRAGYAFFGGNAMVKQLNASLQDNQDTDKPSQSWIGDWWERYGFACRVLHLMQSRLTRSQSDSFRFIQICSDPLIPTQIHSVSPRSTQSQSDLLWLTQILAISHRFAQLFADSYRFTQIRSDSQNFTQSHSDSPNLAQICSDPFSCTQIHSDSLSLAPDSL